MKLNFGNQIRLNRRRMNLTQEQLAEKFGTSPQAISRWEIGATYLLHYHSEHLDA